MAGSLYWHSLHGSACAGAVPLQHNQHATSNSPHIGWLLVATILLLPLLSDALPAEKLEYQRSMMAHEWWRWWSAHLVHFGITHLAWDGLALLIFCALLEPRIGHQSLLLTLFLSMPLISLALWLSLPEMQIYRGSSALVSVLWSFSGLLFVVHSQARSERMIGYLLWICLIIKLIYDAQHPLTSALPTHVYLVWQAHAWGGLIGILLAIGWISLNRVQHHPLSFK